MIAFNWFLSILCVASSVFVAITRKRKRSEYESISNGSGDGDVSMVLSIDIAADPTGSNIVDGNTAVVVDSDGPPDGSYDQKVAPKPNSIGSRYPLGIPHWSDKYFWPKYRNPSFHWCPRRNECQTCLITERKNLMDFLTTKWVDTNFLDTEAEETRAHLKSKYNYDPKLNTTEADDYTYVYKRNGCN